MEPAGRRRRCCRERELAGRDLRAPSGRLRWRFFAPGALCRTVAWRWRGRAPTRASQRPTMDCHLREEVVQERRIQRARCQRQVRQRQPTNCQSQKRQGHARLVWVVSRTAPTPTARLRRPPPSASSKAADRSQPAPSRPRLACLLVLVLRRPLLRRCVVPQLAADQHYSDSAPCVGKLSGNRPRGRSRDILRHGVRRRGQLRAGAQHVRAGAGELQGAFTNVRPWKLAAATRHCTDVFACRVVWLATRT